MKRSHSLIWLIIMLVLAACSPKTSDSRPTDSPNTTVDESVVPDKGQPDFPALGLYWVVDNGCNFDADYVRDADQVFEKLRLDHIAEVVVICQTGVQNFGPYNDEKIWSMKWGNWARLGDAKDKRGVVILIRPDVKPEENRITIENSIWIYQNTVMDYFPVIEEAARFANYDDLNGCLESLARNLNDVLRRVVTNP